MAGQLCCRHPNAALSTHCRSSSGGGGGLRNGARCGRRGACLLLIHKVRIAVLLERRKAIKALVAYRAHIAHLEGSRRNRAGSLSKLICETSTIRDRSLLKVSAVAEVAEIPYDATSLPSELRLACNISAIIYSGTSRQEPPRHKRWTVSWRSSRRLTPKFQCTGLAAGSDTLQTLLGSLQASLSRCLEPASATGGGWLAGERRR